MLVTDYKADAIVLRFKDGEVTLNQDWAGWDNQPAALAVVPEPRHLESL